MKRALILIVALHSYAAFGACDCLITPFPASCAKECMGKLLAKADYIQLRESLGLSVSTSRKISNLPNREKITSIDAFAWVLDRQEMAEVKTKLSKVDDRTVAAIFYGNNDKLTRPR